MTETSLINIMFWQQRKDGDLNTKAVIRLSNALAFGTGYDSLVWNIRSAPNEFGGTQVAAKGVFPISAIRGKVKKIHKLRRMLDKKAKNFRSECEFPITT